MFIIHYRPFVLSAAFFFLTSCSMAATPEPMMTNKQSAPVFPSTPVPPSNAPTPEQAMTNTQLTPAFTLSTTPLSTPSLATFLPDSLEIISSRNADRLSPLASWGRGILFGVRWSPDGRLIAATSTLGISIYDADSLKEIRYIKTDRSLGKAFFSPDGSVLAARTASFPSDPEGTDVKIWRLSDGALLQTLDGETPVEEIVFSPDGTILASTSDLGIINLWQISSGTLLRSIKVPRLISNLVFSPDGKTIALGLTNDNYDGVVNFWNVSDGMLARSLLICPDMVRRIAFSPSGDLLGTGSNDGKVRIWRVNSGELLQQFSLHDPYTISVEEILFRPDEDTLITSDPESVEFFQLSSGKRLHTLKDEEFSILDVALSPDGNTLLSIQKDEGMKFWELPNWSLKKSLGGFTGVVYRVDFSPDGSRLAAEINYSSIFIWRMSDGSLERIFRWYTAVALSPDGEIMAVRSRDATAIILLRISDGSMFQTLELDSAPSGHGLNEFSFSPDGSLIAAGASDGRIRIWRTSDGTLLRTLSINSQQVMKVDFSPQGSVLAAVSQFDKPQVLLWRVSDGTLLQKWEESSIGNIHFSPNGEILAIASRNRIVLLQISDGVRLDTLTSTGPVQSFDFSPDGTLLASAETNNENTVLTIWLVSNGTMVWRSLENPEGYFDVKFSPNGTLLATGSGSGEIRLWGIA
jgi:WD40 repeat protein